MSLLLSLRPFLVSAAATIAIALSPVTRAAGEIYEKATEGTNVTLGASSDGNPAPTFKWLKDGVVIPGATNSTLVLSKVTAANNGAYNVVATNSLGYALSNDLILTVTSSANEVSSPPYFTVQPYPSASAPAGSALTLSSTAVGTPSPTYQWRKNGVAIASATNSFLSFASLTSSSAGVYSVVATNSAGSATSNNSVLTVSVVQPSTVAPVITTEPLSMTVSEFGSATFKIAASGTPIPTYQWRKDGVLIPGATNSLFSIASVTTSNAGTYSVTATNSAGSATSSNAVLTVVVTAPVTVNPVPPTEPVTPAVPTTPTPPPSVEVTATPLITTQPTSVTVSEFGSASFNVAASGTPTPTFQWRKDGVSIPGATNSLFSLASVTTSNSGTYSVTATNSVGSATSSNAVLTVMVTAPVTVNPVPPTEPVPPAVPTTPTPPPSVEVTQPTPPPPAPTTIAPTFTTQPLSQTVLTKATASFTVAASGTPTLTFQWYKDGVAIPGETNPWYTISGASPSHAGTYTVVATNGAGSVTSTGAVLTVNYY